MWVKPLGGLTQKITDGVTVNYYRFLNGTFVMHRQIDMPNETKSTTSSVFFFEIYFPLPFCYHSITRYISPITILPSVVKYGWKFSNDLLVPIITDNLSAYLAFAKMSSCDCKKEYIDNILSVLNCTKLCKCNSWESDGNAAENDTSIHQIRIR